MANCDQHPDYEVGQCRPCQIHVEKVLDGWSSARLEEERLLDLEGWGEHAPGAELLLRKTLRRRVPLSQPHRRGHASHESRAAREGS